MFKYIDMPKLVAFYLREFSYRKDGEVSFLYKFIFCLCLPFVFPEFNRIRLIALAIAECTNSQDQIKRLLEMIFADEGLEVEFVPFYSNEYYMAYDDSDDKPDFPYDNSYGTDRPLMSYNSAFNSGIMTITLKEASETAVRAYLELLIPFYISIQIKFI